MQESVKFLTHCSDEELNVQLNIKDSLVPFIELTNSDLAVLIEYFSVNDSINVLHQEWLKAGSLERANLIKFNSKIFFNNYGEVDFSWPINWNLGKAGQDNLTWQLHSMFFLKDLIAAHKSTNNDEYLKLAVSFIKDWRTKNVSKEIPSIFSWNDHSTAFRLYAMTNLLIYCLKNFSHDSASIKLLINLIIRHQMILAEDGFYSKGTNHGLDQAYYLYFSATVLKFDSRADVTKKIAFERLKYELKKSFSEDGVHIENSPEYHDLILGSVLKINQFVNTIESLNVIEDYDNFAVNALKFLTFVIRPDGCFPPIGDSTIIAPRYDYKTLSELPGYNEFCFAVSKGVSGKAETNPHAVFSTSGYCVMQSKPDVLPFNKRIHMIFKCGFLSYYHRQDDDNNVVVFAHGEEWLTDGGLYKHDHNDPQREHIRSHYAHNVMAPEGGKAERRHCPTPPPAIIEYALEDKSGRVKGKTTMFKGFVFTRELYYNGELEFFIKDEGEKLDESISCNHFEQYWQIPADKRITIQNNSISIESTISSWIMQVSIDSVDLVAIEEIKQAEGSYFGWRSSQYNILEPVQVIRCQYRINGNRAKSLTKFCWFYCEKG